MLLNVFFYILLSLMFIVVIHYLFDYFKDTFTISKVQNIFDDKQYMYSMIDDKIKACRYINHTINPNEVNNENNYHLTATTHPNKSNNLYNIDA